MKFLLAFCLLLVSFVGAAAAQPVVQVPASQAQIQMSFAPVVKKTAPAVVNIYTRKVVQQRVFSPFLNDPFFQHFFGGGIPQGMSRQRLENSLGSGVIVRHDGLIVTSNHVIDGADEITVVLSDRREFAATVVSADSRSDLALLQINAKGEGLPFLEIRDSDEAEVGDLVIAIGNPFGVGQTVTTGIVSAIARTSLDINDINYYIQTDAAINPGNSGGALVGVDGRLLGINAAIYSKSGGNMGIGFAIPSNMVRAAMDSQAAGHKSIIRPWTGIKGQTVTADLAASLGLTKPVGVLVKGLHPASPALKAGLKVGDVLISVAGKEIDDPSAFAYRIATMPIGSDVDVGFMRAGKPSTARFKLISPPESTAREETVIKGRNPLSGVKVANMSPAIAEEYGIHDVEEGVVVLDVSENAVGARLGLDRGDVILGINGEETPSVSALLGMLASQQRGWQITLKRGGEVVNLLVR